MNISTTELLNRLKRTDDFAKFFEDNKNEFSKLSCTELLNEMLTDKKISLAKVAKASGQGDYVYKVFQGKRKPSRDIVIAIAVGMELSIEEAQLLLRISKLAALDPRDKRDSAILYGLKEKFDINRINDLLYEVNEATL
ncbi:MAG: helix-turn-helix domain-containing protein [Oscillospiraceae bacterium]